MSDSAQPSRGMLIRWGAWFGLVNGALFALVGVRYLLIFGAPQGVLAAVYVAAVYVTHFALLGFLPTVLFTVLAALLRPRWGVVLPLGIVVGSLGLSLMLLDTNVFEQNRFHLSALSVALFETSTWVLTGVVFLALLGFEAMLAGHVRAFVTRRRSRGGVWLALALVVAWAGGQSIHIWADATAYTQVTSFTRFLPLYFPIKAKRRLAKLGWVDQAEVERQRMLRQADAPDTGQLRYPLNPLSCSADAATLPNIVMLVVDALRPDRITPEVMPVTAAFAAGSQQFMNQYSGGNSSRMGFFSLFYGLPSTYWQSFYDLQRQPVLMAELQRRGYDMLAVSGVGFGSPAQIDRTVFAGVPASERLAAGETGVDENIQASDLFIRRLQAQGDKAVPYFGFVYYDPGSFAAAHMADIDSSLSAVRRRELAYMQSLADADREIARVLKAVEAFDNGRDTLVIITSDHGYEFDELGLGYIGHASNFGPWQLHSTMLIRWPGRAPKVYQHRSAHQDLPATLLQDVLGCTNPASDYSSGHNLLDETSWEWMIAGSYTSHAIITPEQTVVTYPGGLIEVLGPDYRPHNDLVLDTARLQDAMVEMRRFYR